MKREANGGRIVLPGALYVYNYYISIAMNIDYILYKCRVMQYYIKKITF